MSNPFDDDVDDNALYNQRSNNKNSYGVERSPVEEELDSYHRQIEETMQNTLASTGRSLRALEESEQVGINTAQDLISQGEKLRNVDKNLDSIQQTTTQTQRNLNSIKSMFGGIKNYFSKAPAATATPKPTQSSASSTKLQATMDKLSTNETYDSSSSSKMTKSASQPGGSLPPSSKQALSGTRWGAMDDEIDENLDMMTANLRRLKELGLNLGEEIEDQNKLLDNITTKADKADLVIRDQDKQMRKILGGGKKPAAKPTEKQEKQ